MLSESENKSIIAMKGHTFTRKTELAKHIADSLKCPVLSLDHFLDYIQTSSSSNTRTPLASPQPPDMSFRVICQIAKSNLVSGLVKEIVIDSPLSSQSHLDQLIELSSSLEQTRLIIIECRAENIYKWQTNFLEYLERNPNKIHKWYKAKNWEDVEKAFRCGYDERSDGYKVPKLVVDPIYDYVSGKSITPFMDAVEYMIKRIEGDGPDLVVYRRWLQGQYLPSCAHDNELCRAGSGHYITNYAECEAKCRACEKQVLCSAFTCQHCNFALHKECAELLDDNSSNPLKGRISDRVQNEFRCSLCEGKDNLDCNSSCGECLFTNYIKSRQMPTVIRHDCEKHFLSVVLSDLNPYEEFLPCKACGDAVESIWYSCKICSVAYHYECLTKVPARLVHEHGGHQHHMLLQYSSKDAEDYICDLCFEKGDPDRRDPWLWFYSCEECPYVTHLFCVCHVSL